MDEPKNDAERRSEEWASRHLSMEVAAAMKYRAGVCQRCPRCKGFSPKKSAVHCHGTGWISLTSEGGCDLKAW